jgi:hypothetical protein
MNIRDNSGWMTAVGSIVVLFLAGCTSGSTGGAEQGERTASGSQLPAETASDSTILPAPTTAAASPVQIFDRSGRRQAGFSTPNGNIVCAFAASPDTGLTGSTTATSSATATGPTGRTGRTTSQVRCEIIVKDWQPPARPAGCTEDWAFGIVLDTRAELLCAGDTVRGDSLAGTDGSVPLPYGTSIRFDPFTCSSQKAGVDCVNTATHAGFLLSRDRYALRNP